MKIVTFGEIMLRLTPPGFQRFTQTRSFEVIYGGAEANTAISLANYGEDVEFITRLPENDLGDACLMSLRGYGIHTSHIVRGGERIGIYFLETGAAQRGSNVIYDRANSSFATIQTGSIDWKKVFEGADWFHWTGITPAVSQAAADVCLDAVRTARNMNLIISTDLNYRSKLWKWGKEAQEVMPGLFEMCDVALVNEDAAEKMLGIKTSKSQDMDVDNYRVFCAGLRKKYPSLKVIAITLRNSISASHNTWSGLLWSDGNIYSAPVYDILPIVDRIGTGDAFMGGLIYGLRKFEGDPQKTLDFAVAAGCLKHSIAGDSNAVSFNEVEALMNGDTSGRVSR